MKSKETIIKTTIIVCLTILLTTSAFFLIKGWIGGHFQIAVPCVCNADKAEQHPDVCQNNGVIIITNHKFPPVFLKKVCKKDAVK